MVRGPVGRQAACAIERDPSPARQHFLQEDAQEEGEAPQQAAFRRLQGAGLSLQVCAGARVDGRRLAAAGRGLMARVDYIPRIDNRRLCAYRQSTIPSYLSDKYTLYSSTPHCSDPMEGFRLGQIGRL